MIKKLNFINKIDPRSGYLVPHVIKTIFLLDEPKGRNRIMLELNLKEASTRTLLRMLEKNKIVKPTTKGHTLTKKGKDILKLLRKNIIGPFYIRARLSKHIAAYIVKRKANRIKRGLEQRDQAIRLGADGMLTLIYKNRLYMPGLSNFWKKKIGLKDKIELKLSNSDVILIGYARNKITADLATLNSAFLLLRKK